MSTESASATDHLFPGGVLAGHFLANKSVGNNTASRTKRAKVLLDLFFLGVRIP